MLRISSEWDDQIKVCLKSEVFSTFFNQLMLVYIVFPSEIAIPLWAGPWIAFLRFIATHPAGTIRVQICWNSTQGEQRVVWWFWAVLDLINGLFPVFPSNFTHRTEEDTDSSLESSSSYSKLHGFRDISHFAMRYCVGLYPTLGNVVGFSYPWVEIKRAFIGYIKIVQVIFEIFQEFDFSGQASLSQRDICLSSLKP